MEEIKSDKNQVPTQKVDEPKQKTENVVQQKNDSYKVQVECTNPKEINGHTVYTIKGEDQNGQFEIQRRFNDFYLFRQVMTNKWPGNYIPPIPPKKVVGNMDSSFVEERRQDLDYFLKQLALIPYLWNSEENNLFIRSSDIEKLNLLSKVDYSQLIQKYASTFNFLQGKEVEGDIIQKIAQFSGFLKFAIQFIETYKTQTKQALDAQIQYNNELAILLEFTFPQYEQNCLKFYLGNLSDNSYITQTNSENPEPIYKSQDQICKKSELDSLMFMFKTEVRDIEAMQEALDIKTSYDLQKKKFEQKLEELKLDKSKAEQGQVSVKAKITNKTIQQVMEELTKEIQNTEEMINSFTLICDSIAAILGYVEIDKFKSKKMDSYYQIQKKISQFEIQIEENKEKYWKTLLTNKNLQ